MTRSALRRHKSDAEGDDDEWRRHRRRPRCGLLGFNAGPLPEWDWNLRAMLSGGLPPTAV